MGPQIRQRILIGKAAIRVAVFLFSAAVSAALTTGITLAVISHGTPVQSGAAAAGTVSLSTDVTGACSVANVLPGSSPSTCTLKATYVGSAPGYMGLDILIETQSGNGSTNLYSPADASHDLQVSLSSTSPAVTYSVPTVATTCAVGAPTGSTCYELDKELVSASPFTNSTPAVTFTVSMSVPASATTGYRGGAAQIYLTAHAVQAHNNTLGGCVAGASCTSLQWS